MRRDKEGNELVEKIVEVELGMFKSVNSTVYSPCQDRLKTFKVMRQMHHSVMPVDVLESQLNDLQKAVEDGRNFMTEKYARMENRIPPLKQSEEINQIVEVEIGWQEEVTGKYPNLFPEKNSVGFRNYLSCELETLSDRTLELLHAATMKAFDQGRNLVEERYDNLFKSLGYDSIEAREAKEGQKS